MKARRLLVAILVLAAVASVTLIAQSGDGGEVYVAVGRLFRVMDMESQYEQNIESMLDLQIQQAPQLRPYRDVMLEFFATYMSWKSLEEEVTELYAESFTADEIYEIIEFYETPVGQKALRLMPELSARGAEIGQRRVMENMGELERMITDAATGR